MCSWLSGRRDNPRGRAEVLWAVGIHVFGHRVVSGGAAMRLGSERAASVFRVAFYA
jgi:hypothetical protein